jgi:precorrin-3B methylase
MAQTKREENLEEQLRKCKEALHREKQKNKDLHLSRNRYKQKTKVLVQKVKEVEAIKKNGMLSVSPNHLSKGTNIRIL